MTVERSAEDWLYSTLPLGQPIVKPAGFTLTRTLFPFDFWRDAGGQIAIVHAGTQMWCIDTMATASRGDQVLGGPVPPSDFLVDQSTPELFLENCVAGSSQYSLNAKYGKIWKRGGHFPMATFTSDGGSVVDY